MPNTTLCSLICCAGLLLLAAGCASDALTGTLAVGMTPVDAQREIAAATLTPVPTATTLPHATHYRLPDGTRLCVVTAPETGRIASLLICEPPPAIDGAAPHLQWIELDTVPLPSPAS